MANNPNDGYAADDFLEQIFSIHSYAGLPCADSGSSSETAPLSPSIAQLHHATMLPLGLSLDNGRDAAADNGTFDVKPDVETVTNMANFYPGFDQLQAYSAPHRAHQAFQGYPTASTALTVPHQPSIRPRVRARRGQATDPHSIAERLRRERISERIKALQELVPTCNKTDRAVMLDEILDYVKFLRLQVKVLSMSRMGGAGAVAQLVADFPLQSIEGETSESVSDQSVWDKWTDEDTEREVAKLMEEDMGAALQFLQSKSLCIMPISLAALIYPTTTQPHNSTIVEPDKSAPP